MIKINGESVTINRYPAGEQKLRYKVTSQTLYQVEWVYEKEEELLTLIYLCRHLQTHGGILDVLSIPYLPNARMDRVADASEVFTLKYCSELINSLGFSRVYIDNPHSPVSLGLIDRSEDGYLFRGELYHNNGRIVRLIKRLGLTRNKDILFYPDSGSAKKYESILPFPALIGHKRRDWQTGKLTGLDIVGTVSKTPFDVLIVDDICSYGGTFLLAARKLKEMGADKIYLYITHCENSVLLGNLLASGLLEKIYTSKSILTEPPPQLIEVLED